ncbi:MAG: peptide deformylase [Phycisphaerales bacterium]
MVDVAKCKITRWPTPVLLEKAKPIETIDDNIRALAEKMKDIMVELKGVGLAGPQAGVNLRIFVASEDGTKEKAKVYINPVIETSGSIEAKEEGCLSLPGIWGNIKRFYKCSLKALDENGKEMAIEAEGHLARIYQHEYDHLEGTLIADKFSTVAKIGAKRKLKHLREDYENQNNET